MDDDLSALAESLTQSLNARPFDALGPHPSTDGWCIRVYQPRARTIEVLSLADGEPLGTMTQVHPAGLFELEVTTQSRPAYRLDITTSDGHRWDSIDPYQLGERSYQDFPCDAASLYRNLGAQLCQARLDGTEVAGVRFAVYAPNARSVSLIGDFNDWDGRRHPLGSHDDGVWRLFVPGMAAGDAYKFELRDASGQRLPHKSDPVNFHCTQHPDFNSVVVDQQRYRWGDDAWRRRPRPQPHREPLSIYEVHAGSWRRRDGRVLNYRELADALIPYVREMAFTHLEFLPLSEHPFDGSWGYQPLGLFAPTSRHGEPDDLKYLIDRCHQAGIGVILDWVPAHFPADEHGLARFDGTPLYEYADPQRGWHPDWQSYIYDLGRPAVRDFLLSSALYWLDVFHADGLRVDAVASLLYLDYSRGPGEWTPNVDGGNHNYEAIDFLKRFNETLYARFPQALSIAEESTSFDGVTRPTDSGGLGFGFKWNLGWMHDSLSYMKRDPVHRHYHHDQMAFTLAYAFEENFILPLSHDEVVHGKGTVLTRMPGDDWQRLANLRAYYGWLFAHPGKKLSFMGNEFAQAREWNHRDQLDWHLLDDPGHAGVRTLFADLNRLHRTEPALHRGDCSDDGARWINAGDADNAVFSLVRRGDADDEPVIVLVNFTPRPLAPYQLGVPAAGHYEILLNTDSHHYGGSNHDIGTGFDSQAEAADGLPHSLVARLPPLAAIYLKRRDG